MLPRLDTPLRLTSRIRGVLLLGLLVGAACSSAAQGISDKDLVEQFFPQRLIDEWLAEPDLADQAPFRASAYVAADLNGTGSPEFLVAAYTNSESAVIRVLKKQDGSAVLVDEPQIQGFSGIFPTVSLIDLDRSGRPQVLVELSSPSGESSDWIFKWDGHALTLFGPTKTDSGGLVWTLLGDASFVDLDGDGILEIVDPSSSNRFSARDGEPFQYTVLKLTDGTYAETNTVFDCFLSFARGPKDPAVYTKRCRAANPGVPYTMTIANGDGRDEPPVSSAQILLNGVPVAGAEGINRQVKALQLPLTVAADNTVKVTISGDAGSELCIGIGPAPGVVLVSVTPASATLHPSQARDFRAAIKGSGNTAVTWGTALGPGAPAGAEPGTVSASGLYTAPASIPNPYTVIVTATSQADTTKSASATVTLEPPESVSAAAPPTGPASGLTAVNYGYSAGGATSSFGHPLQYRLDWGDGSTSGWLPKGTASASHVWASAGTYQVTAQARCYIDPELVSASSGPLAVVIRAPETISPPVAGGPASGLTATSYTYSASGATSSYGHQVQYQFYWNDGVSTDWLAVGATSTSRTFTRGMVYQVTVQARCATDTATYSAMSSPLTVVISGPETVSPATLIQGPSSASAWTAYPYTASAAVSSSGHALQYQFDWGDGTHSSFLAPEAMPAWHSWGSPNNYAVTVTARCAIDTAVASAVSSPMTVVVAPALTPVIVRARGSGTSPNLSVTLTWNAPTAGPFTVQRATDAAFTDATTLAASLTALTYADTPVSAGTYYYRVGAVSGDVTTWSAGVYVGPPAAPTNLTVTLTQTTPVRVRISFMNNSPSGPNPPDYSSNSGFSLRRTNVADGSVTQILVPAVGQKGLVIPSMVMPEGSYMLQVQAQNAFGTSEPSNTVAFTAPPAADLRITKIHSDNFAKGQTGATYTITVSNIGTAPTDTSGVSIGDVLPTGLTATAMSGTGWNCVVSGLLCLRYDVLAAGASYPPVTLRVNVAANAPATVTNTATVSGGGGASDPINNTATDPATIVQ